MKIKAICGVQDASQFTLLNNRVACLDSLSTCFLTRCHVGYFDANADGKRDLWKFLELETKQN